MELDDSKKKVRNNTVMLYLYTIAKIVFPLVTLPYLTRVLTTDCYGVVTYVKSFIVYTQLIVDFGFLLSSVKDIIRANGDAKEIGLIVGQTVLAKVLLALVALMVTIIVGLSLPILRDHFLYTVLSYVVVFLSCFLTDFLFRGIEKMQYVSITFLVMKGVSTILTVLIVKGDADIMWIPVLDIISSVAAITLTFYIIKFKLHLKIRIVSLRKSLVMLRQSFVYFLSDVATTAFGALNTLMIGIFVTDLTQIAYWGLCMNLVAAIQSLYAPITGGVYPYMVKKKDLSIIHKILKICLPVLLSGAIAGFFLSKYVLLLFGGENYMGAESLLRALIPLIFISFPAMLYGWPTLGSIEKNKETTLSTTIAAIIQVLGLLILLLIHQFNLVNIAFLRFASELCMLSMRLFFTYKNRSLFIGTKTKEKGT